MFSRPKPLDDVAPDTGATASKVNDGVATHTTTSAPIIAPAAAKGVVVPPPSQEHAAPEDAIVRDSWMSFASTAASRNSAAPSIFSVGVRASTASASTRYSVRQSSIESPISATSPLFHDLQKSDGRRYCCTFCEAAFESKTEWKLHEFEFHDRRERYVCASCSATFPRPALLAQHHNEAHSLEPVAPLTVDSVQYTAIRSVWGCGFCAAFVTSRNDFLDHVGSHYDEGKERSEWQHTRVIEGLLRQPRLEQAWATLVAKEEQARGARLRFFWDSTTTGRAVDGGEPHSLQDMLEFFATGSRTADEVATAAYASAQIRLEGNVGGLVRRLFQRNSEAKLSTSTDASSTPQLTSPGTDDDVISPMSPLPPPFGTATALPQISTLQLASPHSTFHSPAWDGACKADKPMLKTVEAIRPQLRPVPSAPVLAQPRIPAGQAATRPFKPNAIRRVDSSRNLVPAQGTHARNPAGNEDPPRMGTQSSSSPLQPPPISVQIPDRTEQSADAQSCFSGASPASPASSHPGTCLSVTKLRAVSSVRPYTSSSTLSTRTRDGSQGFDDSTGEVMSDDSLSEPDAWLEFDGISAATNNWKRAFQRAVDRGMGRLWARYNHDWDAQIRQRPGGEK